MTADRECIGQNPRVPVKGKNCSTPVWPWPPLRRQSERARAGSRSRGRFGDESGDVYEH